MHFSQNSKFLSKEAMWCCWYSCFSSLTFLFRRKLIRWFFSFKRWLTCSVMNRFHSDYAEMIAQERIETILSRINSANAYAYWCHSLEVSRLKYQKHICCVFPAASTLFWISKNVMSICWILDSLMELKSKSMTLNGDVCDKLNDSVCTMSCLDTLVERLK